MVHGLSQEKSISWNHVATTGPMLKVETTSCLALCIGAQTLPTMLGGGRTSSETLFTPLSPPRPTLSAWSGARSTSSPTSTLVFFRWYTPTLISRCGSVVTSLFRTATAPALSTHGVKRATMLHRSTMTSILFSMSALVAPTAGSKMVLPASHGSTSRRRRGRISGMLGLNGNQLGRRMGR